MRYLLHYSYFFQLMTLPLGMLSTQNIPSDMLHGCLVLACTLISFIGVVWLREQIVNGGGPEWLEEPVAPNNNNNNNNVNNNNEAANDVPVNQEVSLKIKLSLMALIFSLSYDLKLKFKRK